MKPPLTPGGSSRKKPAPRRILVADDDAFIRDLNSAALVRFGYIVDNAPDGDAAWKAIKSKKYDLLVTDHIMPKLTGLELLKKLREARIDITVIVASGSLLAEDFEQQLITERAILLSKPFNGVELVAVVNGMLEASDEF